MSNIKLIKRRIKSAQNISQITKAMEMVAASKMKKAQETALSGKPYAEKIFQAVRDFAERVDRQSHILLSKGNPNGKRLIILISTNKGLCGGLNTNLFRFLNQWISETGDDFISVGKKGQNFIVRSGKNLTADFSENLPFRNSVPAIIKLVLDGFVNLKYREVYLVYNEFLSALKHIPSKKKILPIVLEDIEQGEKKTFSQFLIEPSITDIVENLLPHYLINQLRSAIFEAEASEHSARMIAMKNATDSALDLMDELTLIFNKARQEKITYEIADMVTARLAVE